MIKEIGISPDDKNVLISFNDRKEIRKWRY
jgi:hypothetical protein